MKPLLDRRDVVQLKEITELLDKLIDIFIEEREGRNNTDETDFIDHLSDSVAYMKAAIISAEKAIHPQIIVGPVEPRP